MRPAGERAIDTRSGRHLRCAHNELLFDNRTQPGWSIQIRTPADRGRDAGRETGEVCHGSTPGSAPACPHGLQPLRARDRSARAGQRRAGERRRSCRHRRLCAGGARRQDPEARLCQPADRAARGLRRGRQFRDLEFHQRHARRPQDRQRQLPDRGRGQGQPVQSQSRRRRGARADRLQQDRPDAGRIDAGDHQSGVHHVRGRGDARASPPWRRGSPISSDASRTRAVRRRGSRSTPPSTSSGGSRTSSPCSPTCGGSSRPTNRSAACFPTTATATPGATSRWDFRRCSTSSATSSPIPAAIRTSATISPRRSPHSSATTARS